MKPIFNPFLCCAITLCSVLSSHAASFSWDGTSTGTGAQGGAGTWDSNTTANWWNGTTNVVWPNTGTDNDAVFGNTAGTVSIATGGVTANDLTFNTTGYLIQNNKLTLVPTSASVGAIINTATSVSSEISSEVAGTLGTTTSNSGLTKSGAGTLTLSGTNTFTGWVTISGGILKVTKAAAINSIGTGSWIFANNGTFELDGTAGNIALTTRFQTNGGTILNTTGDNTISQGVYMNSVASNTIKSDGGSLVISGTVNGGSGNRKLTLSGASTGENRIGGAITNSTSPNLVSVEKIGVGKWILSAANTYSGTTVITQGTLQLGNASTTGSLSTLSAITNNATLAFRRSNTITQGTDFANGIDGTGGILVKSASSSGVVVLGGTNTFQGGVNIASGVLKITSAAALGTGSKVIELNGGGGEAANLAFQLDGSAGGITLPSTISFSASSNTGAGIRNVGGTNEIQGAIGIISGPGGNLSVGSDLGTLTVSGDISTAIANRILQLNGASTTANTISGSISDGSGGISLIKSGTGTWTLSNSNSYDGTTSITGGKLVINGNQSTANGAVTVSGANTRLAGDGTIGGNTTIQASAIHSPGNSPGVQKFTGDLTYADASIFEWDIDRAATQTRGTGYDGVNVTGTLAGMDGLDVGTTTDAVFRIVIGDSDFSNGFWDTTRVWTDIFTAADGIAAKTDWAGIFGGGFEYFYNNGTTLTSISPTGQGSFSFTGVNNNELTWTAVPEPTTALAGLLLGAGLLRRRRG
jgi:autotransporter-associated beta strand protein